MLAEIGKENAVIPATWRYNLVIDVGQSGSELAKRESLDFAMIHVPSLDGERSRKRWRISISRPRLLDEYSILLFHDGSRV